MLDPETGNVLVFNGEIYNHRELRRECEALGARFKSASDTEVILALYRTHGEHCLKKLRGMFAIALWDAKNEYLFLAKDRLGKKPLNYAATPNGLVFCSEISPLAAHPLVDRSLDEGALDLYLQLQTIPAPWTIYHQIRKLPPAHFAIVSQEGFRLQRYWSLDYREKIALSEDDALESLEEKLLESVRLRMASDVPIGALLSGGVDSSIIVALMAKLSCAPVNTYTIGFSEQGFDEKPYAAQVAELFGTNHRFETISGDVEALLPTLARHYGEPYADSSAIPSFHVSRMAREHVAVILNGDGGDELMGGYERYAVPGNALPTAEIFSKLLGPDRIASFLPYWGNASTLFARGLRRLSRDYLTPEMGGLLMLSGYWNETRRAELFNRSRQKSDTVAEWRKDLIRQAFSRGNNPIDRMLWLENQTSLPNDLLVKMDIASMHCGLEARSPLLDHELIEFCAALPVRFKTRRRVGKYLLKRLAEKHLPADFVHRKKMGFGIPVAKWLNGPLRKHVQDVLFDQDLMHPLTGSAIANSWNRLQLAKGADLHAEAGRVWALLMYGHWRKIDLS